MLFLLVVCFKRLLGFDHLIINYPRFRNHVGTDDRPVATGSTIGDTTAIVDYNQMVTAVHYIAVADRYSIVAVEVSCAVDSSFTILIYSYCTAGYCSQCIGYINATVDITFTTDATDIEFDYFVLRHCKLIVIRNTGSKDAKNDYDDDVIIADAIAFIIVIDSALTLLSALQVVEC